MRRRILIMVATMAVVVLGTATQAVAKGADQATITGPTLAKAIVVSDSGEPGTTGHLADLATDAGLYDAMFNSGTTLTQQQPPGALGPKFTIAYRVPDDPATKIIRQDLYPSAVGGPLTYTPAGQTAYGNSPVTPGWFRGPTGFGTLLITIGVPASTASPATISSTTPTALAVRPTASVHSTDRTPVLTVTAILLACMLVVGAVTFRRRRSAGNRPS